MSFPFMVFFPGVSMRICVDAPWILQRGALKPLWRVCTWNDSIVGYVLRPRQRRAWACTRAPEVNVGNHDKNIKLSSRTDAIPGYPLIPVRLWILGPESKTGDKNTDHMYRDEMVTKDFWGSYTETASQMLEYGMEKKQKIGPDPYEELLNTVK